MKTIVDRTEKVHIRLTKIPPADYHCRCRYCTEGFRGVLIRPDGSYYKKTDRRHYYSPAENVKTKKGEANSGTGHIAKTPLHVARWAIQTFTKPGDWVLDPTMGAGTTGVEALNHKRNTFGVEIQFIDIIEKNLAANNTHGMKYHVAHGDARDLRDHLDVLPKELEFTLIVNNPPYSGDEVPVVDPKLGKGSGTTGENMYTMTYDRSLPNLAFEKEGPKYWEDMLSIYTAACERLKVGGHFVIGIKDQMRKQVPDELHRRFAEMMERIPGMKFEGVVILPHYPPTLFMSTYPKRYPNARVPRHQSIVVFKKEAP